MAKPSISLENIKEFFSSQINDEEKWATNSASRPSHKLIEFQKLLRAVGLFAGSVFLMRNFGDLMAI